MQRVELLVWRDFVNTLQKSPTVKNSTLATMHNLTMDQVDEWRAVYNKSLELEKKNQNGTK